MSGLLPEDNPLDDAQDSVESIKPKKIWELSQSKGIKVVVRGRENTFKTGSGLLFPTPEVIDLELGTADLAPFHRDRDITVWETVVMKEKLIDGKVCYDMDKVESIYQFEIAFGEALRSKSETIVIDSISELYDWALEFMKSAGKGLSKKKIMASSYKELMKSKDVQGFDFGISNTIMHNTIMKGLLTKKNFFIVTQDQAVWNRDGPTGDYKPTWMKKVPFWMPIIVNMTVESYPESRTKKYYATIEKYRGHSEVVGDKLCLLTIVGSKAIIENNLYNWLLTIKNGTEFKPMGQNVSKEPLVKPLGVSIPPAPTLQSSGGTILKDTPLTPNPSHDTSKEQKEKPKFEIPDLLNI